MDARQGRCPFGGQHVWDGSDDVFRVPHDIPIDDHLFDILDRYTKWYPQDRILQLVYTLSTGAPYQIQLMETWMTLADPVA